MLNDEQAKVIEIRTAQLGLQADAFMDSELGKYMVDRAEMKKEDAIAQLVVAGAGDLEANTELRNAIRVQDMFLDSLAEALQSGKLAIHNLRAADAGGVD